MLEEEGYTKTEKAGIAVTLETCIFELLGSSLGRDTSYPDLRFFVFFSQSRWTNVGLVLRLCHDLFLPNPF
jgi:hypothetical protein